MAALVFGDEMLCSAFLICRDAAFTAAHCPAVQSGALELVFGETVSRPARTVGVREVISHPLWVGLGNPPPNVGQANDLALLLLEEEVSEAEPLLLWSPVEAEAALRSAEKLIIVGFGSTTVEGAAGQKSVAEAALVQVGDYELRVGLPGEPQACNGDSGGPALLAVEGELRAVGLASRTAAPDSFCAEGTIYTRLDAYLAFLQSLVRLPCGSGGMPSCKDGGMPHTVDAGAAVDRRDSTATGGGWSGSGGSSRPRSDDGCALLSSLPQRNGWWGLGVGLVLLVCMALLRASRRV